MEDPVLSPQLLEMVETYRMPPAAGELLKKHPPLIISGITAAGKEAIIEVIEQDGHGQKVVTHTTRHPRPGEQNGKDYWFVTPARMRELVEEKGFIEVKRVHGLIYGSTIAAYQTVVDEGVKPILRIDVQGIDAVVTSVPNLRVIFLLPPDFDTWMARLEGRGEMSYTERQRRFESARMELENAMNNERFMLVINRDIRQAAKEVIGGQTDGATQHQAREIARKLIDHMNSY